MSYETITCVECDREFVAEGHVEHDYFPGTPDLARVEWVPDDETCPACQGHGRCEGTFKYVAGKYTPIPCCAEGTTRFCVESTGSRSHLGVRCDTCAAWYDDEDAVIAPNHSEEEAR